MSLYDGLGLESADDMLGFEGEEMDTPDEGGVDADMGADVGAGTTIEDDELVEGDDDGAGAPVEDSDEDDEYSEDGEETEVGDADVAAEDDEVPVEKPAEFHPEAYPSQGGSSDGVSEDKESI